MRAGLATIATASVAAALLAPLAASAQPQQAPSIIRPSSTLGPPVGRGGAGKAATGGGATAIDNAAQPGAAGAAGAAGTNPSLVKPNRFRSIAQDETVLFDAPSERAKKIFIAPAGMPVEVLSVLRNWVKVRDSTGDLAWVDRQALTDRRMVISLGLVPMLREPSVSAGRFFDVDGGVVLELIDDRIVAGYAKVRYASGETGYIQADQVWGL